MLKGNEWYFRFFLHFETEWSYEKEMEIHLSYENQTETYWSYELDLEQKNSRTDYESCSVDLIFGYEGEETFNLGKGLFDMSEHHCVWSRCWLNSQKKIKFRFYFDNAVKPLLKNNNERGKQFCWFCAMRYQEVLIDSNCTYMKKKNQSFKML